MPAHDTLSVWMNGIRVGTWTHGRRGPDRFQYEKSWLDSPTARVLSLSLPFVPGNRPHRGDVVAHFFDNLLPDSDAIRRRLRSRFATASTGAFDLLAAIGRDCVGAVQLLPGDEAPAGVDRIEAEPLTEAEVEATIEAALSGAPLPGRQDEDEFRISIAGAQEKTALLFHRKRWRRPLGATPTTHILKLPLGLVGNLRADLHDSVENEWLCLRLLRAFGLETASAEIATFGARKVLVVERFDRARQPEGWIARLPQEDFCQALGLPSSLRYESDGGPGMRDILRVLDASSRAAADKAAFVRAQIVFWMLAATDGHAKNFSLFHSAGQQGGGYRLTPFYDVLSAWPIIGRGKNQLDERKARLAMAVRSKNPHWKLAEIEPRHWDAVTRAAGLGEARPILVDLAERTPGVLETAATGLPKNFPEHVRDRIFAGVSKMAAKIEAHLAR
ncbi:MAG: type II toxin-antitoxin system HipA family toxin [Opitutaceae bacterium]